MTLPAPTDVAALSILIVDDEVSVVAELAEAAAGEGYTVHQAHSAASAVAALARHPEIGVMISDIRMPGCDGLELTRRVLDERHDRAALEVILITGHATLEDAMRAVRSGAFDFVRKPFRLQQIFDATARAMARAIGRRRVAGAVATMRAQLTAPVPPPDTIEGDPGILLSLMHELRTPLVPVLGFAEILESQRCSPADTVEYAKLIGEGARQLLATVDDLFVLAQLERGSVRPNLQKLGSAAFLQALAETHRPAAALMGKSLQVKPDPDVSFAADGPLAQRALDVLLRIALQRSPRGSALTLSARHQSGGVQIEIGEADAPPATGSTAFAEDAARQIAPLGIRFARAVLALHGGSITLAGEEQTAFRALVTMPDAPA